MAFNELNITICLRKTYKNHFLYTYAYVLNYSEIDDESVPGSFWEILDTFRRINTCLQ